MKQQYNKINKRLGVSTIEYAVIAGLIAIAIITALTLMGGNIRTQFCLLQAQINAPNTNIQEQIAKCAKKAYLVYGSISDTNVVAQFSYDINMEGTNSGYPIAWGYYTIQNIGTQPTTSFNNTPTFTSNTNNPNGQAYATIADLYTGWAQSFDGHPQVGMWTINQDWGNGNHSPEILNGSIDACGNLNVLEPNQICYILFGATAFTGENTYPTPGNYTITASMPQSDNTELQPITLTYTTVTNPRSSS